MNRRIAIIKTGWSEDYRGGAVSGDFGYIAENEEGHERFNFYPGSDGRFYGYLPPIGPEFSVPNPPEKSGWLAVFVAKRAKRPGLFIVGWYEDAKFADKYRTRPEYADGSAFPRDSAGKEFSYAIDAPRAVFIPGPLRLERLNTTRIKRTPRHYLFFSNASHP